jgi:hypothetical protein
MWGLGGWGGGCGVSANEYSCSHHVTQSQINFVDLQDSKVSATSCLKCVLKLWSRSLHGNHDQDCAIVAATPGSAPQGSVPRQGQHAAAAAGDVQLVQIAQHLADGGPGPGQDQAAGRGGGVLQPGDQARVAGLQHKQFYYRYFTRQQCSGMDRCGYFQGRRQCCGSGSVGSMCFRASRILLSSSKNSKKNDS